MKSVIILLKATVFIESKWCAKSKKKILNILTTDL